MFTPRMSSHRDHREKMEKPWTHGEDLDHRAFFHAPRRRAENFRDRIRDLKQVNHFVENNKKS